MKLRTAQHLHLILKYSRKQISTAFKVIEQRTNNAVCFLVPRTRFGGNMTFGASDPIITEVNLG